MEAVLSVQSINKHYPGFALENVSFSLAPNRIMGLIGKNGAGKSTTLKAILNMVSPESGNVTMFQRNFYQHEKECKQRIGVVFGGIDFYPLKKLSTITAVTRKFYTNWDQAQYHLPCVIAVIEEFRLHSGLHTLTACIIMAAASCTVHALVDVVFPNGLAVGLTGILCSAVTVDNRSFQCGICSQGIFQCLDAQICFHVCSH